MRDKPYLDIRYSKIHFTVEFVENTEIVREKASALRGGMAGCFAGRRNRTDWKKHEFWIRKIHNEMKKMENAIRKEEV